MGDIRTWTGSFHPAVRRIPVLKTEVSDDGTHYPDYIPAGDTDVKDHLR